jgi:glutathione S-transferase
MVLYSFRRCPYAMRARLAIHFALPSGSIELREVVLKDKPQAMLDISPKGTVPVLYIKSTPLKSKEQESQVLDESLDIMLWALQQSSLLPATSLKEKWLPELLINDIHALIALNDGEFKWALDHYKYSDRYEESEQYFREKGEVFLRNLNTRLTKHTYLMGESVTLADVAIFPFIRQFAHVDSTWFFASEFNALKTWLNQWLESDQFNAIMTKYPKWQPQQDALYFP